jgi:hypothetical protein
MSKSDNVTNLIVVALGLFVAYHSYHSLKLGILISPGAGFLPFLCGTALVVLGLFWRLQAILSKSAFQRELAADPLAAACEAKPTARASSWVKLCLAFVTTVAYALLFEKIGFFAATLVFMLMWQMVVERERWLKAVVITVLCAGVMYALFKILLHVELPSNPLLS